MTRPHDADREARLLDDIGELLGLHGSVTFLPPSRVCGWKEAGAVDGGTVFCLACAPQPPTARHVPVYAQSYIAPQPCVVCGHRLEHVPV